MEGIVTPEAVVLDVETAGVASRVFAGMLDLLVQIGLLMVGGMLLTIIGVISSSSVTLNIILFAFVLMGYPVLSEVLMRGRTIGKRAVGLRAVTLEGAPIRLRHALLRMMGGLVDRYLPPLGVTGMLFVLGTSRHQRVGDLISGTIVIRDPDRTLLPPAVWFPVPPGLDAFAATIDPTAMTDEQYTVIRSFLMRNRQLSADARYGVAADLAGRIAAVLHHDGVSRVHPEAYLLCVISRYQRRNFPQYQPAAWQASAWQTTTPAAAR
ncbi:MAG: RDD family protein [Actinomycetota bacterium]|nr:RDD family protein [Actinomycetota bacterium]